MLTGRGRNDEYSVISHSPRANTLLACTHFPRVQSRIPSFIQLCGLYVSNVCHGYVEAKTDSEHTIHALCKGNDTRDDRIMRGVVSLQ